MFGGCGALVLLAVWLFPDLLPETLKKAEAAVSIPGPNTNTNTNPDPDPDPDPDP